MKNGKGGCMPKIDSPFWNEQLGVCEKHLLPQVPCPQCFATRDKDIEVRLTEMDQNVLNSEPGFFVQDLLPVNDADWLKERIVI